MVNKSADVKKVTTFEALAAMDIKEYIEKKGNFDYLPWADAHKLMKQFDPDAKVNVREFKHYEVVSGNNQDFLIEKDLNYQSTKGGAYVHVYVTLNGKTEDEMYPVTNFSNKPVSEPTTTDVNKSLKRAFVKALAKHGLGLYIYQGEDLPEPIIIELKDAQMIEKLIESIDEKIGESYLPTLIDNINEYTKQKGLIAKHVERVDQFTLEQAGLAKLMIGKKQDQIEKEDKKKKA